MTPPDQSDTPVAEEKSDSGVVTGNGGMPDNSNEALLAMALEATNDGLWVWHIPSGNAYFSPRYYTMLGYEPNELPPTYETWAALLHPDDAEAAKAAIQDHFDRRIETFEVEFRLRTKSGEYKWILGRGKIVESDDDGVPIRMVGNNVNIDALKRTELKLTEYKNLLEKTIGDRTRALDETTSLLEATFDAIPDILGVQDHEHRIIGYNAAGYAFLGKTPEEVRGKRCFELMGRESECDTCATSECYRTKKPASVERYEEGRDVWLDVRAYPIFDENGEVFRVIEHLRDITATKKAQQENERLHEQLQHTQKMEAIGTLAGGIAHDFNNILGIILGNAEMARADIPDWNPARPHLK